MNYDSVKRAVNSSVEGLLWGSVRDSTDFEAYYSLERLTWGTVEEGYNEL